MTKEAQHILLVEDTLSLAEMYETSLKKEGYEVTSVDTAQKALDFVEQGHTDLVLLDLKLPDMNGLDVMDVLNERDFLSPVIIITGHGSINVAVEAMRRGARDFLVKPFHVERLHNAVASELGKNPNDTVPPELAGLNLESSGENSGAGGSNGKRPIPLVVAKSQGAESFSGFIGTSPIMQKLYEQIECAARSMATVFITGESGTGKEVCAEAIHKLSSRVDKPFIPINCAAIPRDLMESELFGHVKGAFTGAIADRDGAVRLANGGTLFLDEIAEMNPDMQTKLLRFLQNYMFQKVGGNKMEKTDVRIICATNRNPSIEIQAGRFREDLFYRLHVLPVYMPPLSERGEDVIDIAQILIRLYAEEEGKDFLSFTEEAENVLRHYNWPGNIRQLQNVVRNVVVMNDGDVVSAQMLSGKLLHGADRKPAPEQRVAAPFSKTNDNTTIRPLADIEREVIERAVEICGGNIPQAAAHLGVSPSTVYRKKMLWASK